MGVDVVVGAAALVVVGVVAGAGLRWMRRRRRDSVEAFAAATIALQHISDQPLIEPEPTSQSAIPPDTPSVHVLSEVARLPLDRTRTAETRRRSQPRRRPDAEVLARRPLIASLPTRVAATPPDDPGRRVG